MTDITFKISNHPLFTDVERYFDLHLINVNFISKSLEMVYQLRYVRDGEDITSSLNQPPLPNIVINNNMKIFLLDEDGERIEDEDWDGVSEDDYDKYKWEFGWDLILHTLTNPFITSQRLEQQVMRCDEEGFFNN